MIKKMIEIHGTWLMEYAIHEEKFVALDDNVKRNIPFGDISKVQIQGKSYRFNSFKK